MTVNINDQILASHNQGVFVGIVTEIREKAIKVDYCWETFSNIGLDTVYSYTTWLPKSVLCMDKEIISLKKWILNKGLNGYNIKRYYLDKGVKVFC